MHKASPTTPASRAAIVAQAYTWLGTPYHHQGRIKGVGVDCIMLIVEVYQSCGLIPAIDPTPYPPDWMMHRDDEKYLFGVGAYAHEAATPQLGDIAVWRFGRCFSHGGILINADTVIHAYNKQGCVTARMDEPILARREVKYFSLFDEAQ